MTVAKMFSSLPSKKLWSVTFNFQEAQERDVDSVHTYIYNVKELPAVKPFFTGAGHKPRDEKR